MTSKEYYTAFCLQDIIFGIMLSLSPLLNYLILIGKLVGFYEKTGTS